MVLLYGVEHEGRHFFGGEVEKAPSEGLLKALTALPRGTRVGLEMLSDEDAETIKEFVELLSFQSGRDVHFDGVTDLYWAPVKEACASRGHEITFLEDVFVSLSYIKRVVDTHSLLSRHPRRKKYERATKFRQRVVELYEKKYWAEKQIEKIHLLERDDAFLKAIGTNKLDVVVAGIGHTAWWMLHPQEVMGGHGITFTNYATDKGTFSGRNRFDAQPNSDYSIAFEREGVERALRVWNKGRFKEERPSLAGVECFVNDIPSPEGYIELFIRQQNGSSIAGEVMDMDGTGSFEGRLTDARLDITKRYNPRCCRENAVMELRYRGTKQGEGFKGETAGRGYRGSFYFTPVQHPSPLSIIREGTPC